MLKPEILLSDVIIGGCIGSIIAALPILFVHIDPGLVGAGLSIVGACGGAVFYNLRR